MHPEMFYRAREFLTNPVMHPEMFYRAREFLTITMN